MYRIFFGLLTFLSTASQADFQEMTVPAGFNRSGETFGASWGDYNGDGLPDLWIGNHADTPNLFFNNGDGTFVDIVNSVWPGDLGDTHSASWIDFDNDGDQDLLEVVGGVGSNHLFVNEGGLFFEHAADYGIDSPGARSRSSAWIDYNRDGSLDVILSHALGSDPKPFILTNTGSFFFDAAIETGVGEHSTIATYIADISEDDIPEIILSSGNPNAGPIYDTSILPFEDLVNTLNIPGARSRIGCSDSVVADFNGDLRNDIFASCGGGGREVVQRNDFLLEMKLSSVSSETAVEFHSASPLTISVFPNYAFEPVDHLQVGSNSIVPEIVSHPELGWRSFSFDLDPQDLSIHGAPVHIPGTDLGLFVSFDVSNAAWRLALSSPASAQLSIVVNGAGTIDNVVTDGFSATPSASWPFFNVRTTGGFEDRRVQSGLGLPLPCPSAVGGDFDNDMDVDIYLVCSRTITNLPNMLFLNDGNGNFVLESDAGGASGSLAGSGDSVVTADYDRDGFIDLFVTNGDGGAPFNNGPHQLFRNIPNGNNWLEIDLVGSTSNRDAIGAIVTMQLAGNSQMRTQDGGFHRRSQNHQRLHFGLAQNSLVSEVRVRWPSGNLDTFFNVPANRIITINEAGNPDLDSDGILDIADNCIDDPNSAQENIDSDEYGDVCDDDMDGDGLPNLYEKTNGLNPRDANDALIDSDGDSLVNFDEFIAQTDPFNPDTDGDGYNDGIEVSAGTDPANATSVPASYELGSVIINNSGWTTVSLYRPYGAMVVLTSWNLQTGNPSVVSRVRNASGSSFEVKLDRLDGSTSFTAPMELHYFVIEEGVYDLATHGIKMEAVKFDSTATDNATSWIGETRTYLQQYDNPVVLGQVMSANDPRFSVFWSAGQHFSAPPAKDFLRTGKHVGEDPVLQRANETIGYIVLDAGSGSFGGRAWTAMVGANSVQGVTDLPPYVYPVDMPNPIDGAFVSSAGVNGVNGGWPVLFGDFPTSNAELNLAIDEDQIGDAERRHVAEQVAYFVLGQPGSESPIIPHETGIVTVGSDSWTTVPLTRNYNSMVVVTSPNYDENNHPSVVRVRNATVNQFELRLDAATGSGSGQLATGIPVHYLVIEEGVYQESVHGINLEAVKFVSSRTDSSADWQGEQRTFSNNYVNPVVLGQVMSYNDPRFSVFWSHGAFPGTAVDSSNIWVGKHIGEDTDVQRTDELIGYIVVEAGNDSISKSVIFAGRGTNSIAGIKNSPPYTYQFSGLSSAYVVLAHQSGMNGVNGGWSILYGDNPIASDRVNIAIDEDQTFDLERRHIQEEVHFLVFE